MGMDDWFEREDRVLITNLMSALMQVEVMQLNRAKRECLEIMHDLNDACLCDNCAEADRIRALYG